MLKTMASKLGLLGLEPHVAKQFYPPSAGCVLYLPGYPPQGAKIIDHSGQGIDGTITGATWVRQPSGLWVNSFDGNDYIDCGSNSSLDFTTQNFTLEAWLKPTTLVGETRTIFARSDIGTTGYLARVTDEGRLDFLTWAPGEGRSYTAINVILINIWYHIAFVRNGTAALFYVNGAVIANESSGTHNNPVTSTQSLLIGICTSPASSGEFIGSAGLCRVSNTALAAGVIANHFNQERHLFEV